jgi:hypothetical protein
VGPENNCKEVDSRLRHAMGFASEAEVSTAAENMSTHAEYLKKYDDLEGLGLTEVCDDR